MAIRRIVAAVDASDPARRAAQRALRLAERFDAELTLVHVYEPGHAEAASLLGAASLIEHNRQVGEQAMKSLTAELGKPELQTILQVGSDVPGTICELSAELQADLLVVGTIGRTGVSRFFLGSVAESVIRQSRCPVWVERPTDQPIGGLQRMVVCTDLSALSEAGLTLGAKLSNDLECEVDVVYALESPYRELGVDIKRDVTKQQREQLEVLAEKHFAGRSPNVTTVEGANVVDGITAFASQSSADLLVLASHGRTGLSRVILGSVAERITRFAPCSVVVARSFPQ